MKIRKLFFRMILLVALLAVLLPQGAAIPTRVARADGPITPAGPPLGRSFDETSSPAAGTGDGASVSQPVTILNSITDPNGDVSRLNWLKPHPRIRDMTIGGNTATVLVPTWLIRNPASFY
jgi:hypothetical protein